MKTIRGTLWNVALYYERQGWVRQREEREERREKREVRK
jgi:hypothetical protein